MGPKKVKKSTKKFQSRQLKAQIESRRRRQQATEKKDKILRQAEVREQKRAAAEQSVPVLKPRPEGAGLGDVSQLNVDELLQADFLASDVEDEQDAALMSDEEADAEADSEGEAGARGTGEKKKQRKKEKAVKTREEEEDDEDEDEDEEVKEGEEEEEEEEEVAQPRNRATEPKRTGKRARDAEEEEEDEQGGSGDEDGAATSDDDAGLDEGDAHASDSEASDAPDDEARLRRDMERHKRELQELAKAEPEFFRFLKKNQESLLHFGEEEEQGAAGAERGDDEPAESDTDGEEKDKSEAAEARRLKRKREREKARKLMDATESKVLTEEMLADLQEHALERRALLGLKRLLRVYRSGCHMHDQSEAFRKRRRIEARERKKRAKRGEEAGGADDDDEDEEEDEAEEQDEDAALGVDGDGKASHKKVRAGARGKNDAADSEGGEDVSTKLLYKFANQKVYSEMMQFCLTHMVQLFDFHLKREKDKPLKQHERWQKIEPLAKSFLGNTLHFLRSIDIGIVRPVLALLENGMAYLAQFPRLCNKYLRILLRLWSSAEQKARIEAFLRIRELCLELPVEKGFLEGALKGSYLTLVRNSHLVNAQTLPDILFMCNCVVELYSIDLTLSYQFAFVYIRQLCIHLRNALLTKSKDSYKAVYNWQFVNCLRVWSAVLAHQATEEGSELRPLVYPFCQLCVGVLQMLPTSRFVPLRLAVCRFLVPFLARVGTYLPLAPHLLNALHGSELARKPKAPKGRPPQLQFLLQASDSLLEQRSYQQAMLSEVLRLLQRYFAAYSYSISFPELVLPTIIALRKFAKHTKIGQARRDVKKLVERLELNSKFVLKHRASVNYAPKDMAKKKISVLATFSGGDKKSPLERFEELERAEEAKRAKSAAHAGPEEQGRKGRRMEEEDDEDDEDGGDGEDEAEEDQGEDEEEEDKSKMRGDARRAAQAVTPAKPAAPAVGDKGSAKAKHTPKPKAALAPDQVRDLSLDDF